MISQLLNKILFIDIETVGISSTFENFKSDYPELYHQYIKYYDWFLKRFPEDDTTVSNSELADKKRERIFEGRSALVPEFAKIICVSMAFVMDNGEVKKQTFSGDNEKELLTQVRSLLDRCHKLDFYLCGHNLKNFDIPMMAKRMIINGIMPSKLLPSYDTKPWEVKAIDTKEIWQYGSYTSIGSLDLVCSTMGIPTPKDGEVTGDKVHNSYWVEQKLPEIAEYCEGFSFKILCQTGDPISGTY
jgi:predicted PolB exonuclease-like 3'-5' exonuclease